MATTKRRSPGNKAKGPAMIGKGDQTRIRRTLRTHPRVTAFAVGAAFAPWFLGSAFADPAANQLPTGGQIGAGSVTIATAGTKMQIDQASDKAIINWNCFCIGSNAWVNFNQPSASSVVLNRSTQAAEIFGRMSANGQVFVTSGAGVYFGRTAQVDVGSLFASSLSISDQNFLAGRYVFSKDGSAGEVVNEGTIVAVGGYAALAGPQVRNNGIIIAQAGTVALAAGDRVSLDMIGDGLVKVSVDAAALNALALNAGTLQADGGRVVMTARSASALLDTVLNNTGIIRATTLVERKGEIVLDGGDKGVVANSGTVTATGMQAGQQGGNIVIVGQYVALNNGTRIDASGDVGGGNVNVGGNFQGQGPLQNASQTIVAKDASIKADAITNGDGGNVVVWSNDATQVHGSISARGGANSGNGGLVETSGHHLNVKGARVDTRAARGSTGTWLLDPADVTVVHDDGTNPSSPDTTNPFADDGATPAFVTDFDITANLATTSVLVTATRDIFFDTGAPGGYTGGAISISSDGTTPGTNLTFDATRHISFTGGATTSIDLSASGGQLNLRAGTGSITHNAAGDILALTGTPLLAIAGTGIDLITTGVTTLAATTAAGGITIANTGSAISIDTLDGVANGDLAGGATSANGLSTVGGDVLVTNNNNITSTLAGTITTTSATEGVTLGSSGSVTLTASAGNISLLGAITTTGFDSTTVSGAAASGGQVNLTATAGSVSVAGINTSGGNNTVGATGDDGGDAASINISSGTDTTVNASLTSRGGTGDAAGNDAAVAILFGQTNGGASFTLAAAGVLDGGTNTVTGGGGADTFNINATANTTATLNGGAGSDTVAITKDSDFTLTDASLTTTGGVNLTLSSIQVANLTGGASANSFTVSGWTGTGTLDGAGGTDTVVASQDAATFTLTDTTLDRTGTGQLTLTAIETATLTGGGSANTFNVSTWTGTANLDGAAGDDVFNVTTSASGTVNVTGGTHTTADTLNVTGSGAIGVSASAVTNGQTVNYATVEAVNVNGGGAADTFTLTGSAAGVTYALNGNGGTNTVVLSGDGDFTLTDTSLSTTAAGFNSAFGLTSITVANLTGGASANSFTVSGWTGTGTLDGAGGTDTVVASQDAATFTLTDTTLDRTGTGQLTLTAIETATLTGGGSANTFNVSTWTGTANLDGAAGDDVFNVTTSASGTVNVTGGTHTTADTLNVTGSGAIGVSASAVTNGQTVNYATVEAVNVNGGGAADTFTLTGSAAGVTYALNGNGGTNTVVLSGDGDFTLTDTSLSTTAAGFNSAFGLTSITVANLTGGASANSFTVSGWTGTGTLDGAGGTDTVVASQDAATFTLTDTTLDRTGTGQLTLTAIETATLTGGGSANTFNVSTWTGTANLDGAAGDDVFNVTTSASGTVNVTGGTHTTADTLNVTGSGAIGVSASAVTNGQTVNYATVEAVNVNGGGAADTFTLTGSAAGVTYALNGNGGTNTVVLSGDGDFTLTDTSLSTTAAGFNSAFGLTSITVANLTGGASANSFTVSGWTGTGTLDGAGGTDTVVASQDAATFTLTDTTLDRTGTGQLTLTAIETATLTGGGSANTFNVSTWTGTANLDGAAGDDVFNVTTSASGTVNVTGGTHTTADTLNVTGSGAIGVSASAVTNGQTVNYATVEAVNVNGGGAADTFTLTGSAAGVTYALNGNGGTNTVVLSGDGDFTLTDTSLSTTAAGFNSAFGLTSITVANLTGGASANSFTVSGWTGTGTLDGAGGTDTVVATNDVASFVLTDTTLDRTGTGQLTLASIESATLTGGGSANSFTVSGWTGTGTLDGAGGTDTVVATNDVASFVLTDTTLDRTGTGQLTLASIESATLTGGGSANSFTVSGWTGTGTLDGAGGTDTVVASQDAATFTLTDTTLDRTGTGQLTLTAIETATLTGGGSANTFNVSTWTGTANLDGAAGDDVFNVTTSASGTVNVTGGTHTTADTLNVTGSGAIGVSASAVTNGQTVNYATVEAVNVNGGGAADTFTLTGSAAGVTYALNGNGGTNTVVLSGDGDFTLTDTSLSTTAAGFNSAFGLTSITVANLTGGASANSFTVSGWTGTGTLDGAGGTDTVVASQDAATFTLTDTTLDRTGTGQLTLTAIETATLTGGGSANTFNVSTWTGTANLDGAAGDDVFNVTTSASGTVNVTGGTHTTADTLNVTGSGAIGVSASAVTNGQTVNYATVEAVNVNGGGAADTFTLTGSAAGVTYALNGNGGTNTVVLSGDGDFTLTDTSLSTTAAGFNSAFGLTSITVANLTGGASANSFTVSGWTGTGTLDGAGGTDTVVATNDVASFVLTDTTLDRTGTGQLTLASIESATLTGGGSANSFTVSGWTGTGTLDGAGGTDTVVATNDVASFVLTDTTLDRTGTGQLTLASIESATLTGGGSANSFTVSGWTGTGTLDGAGGTDTVVATNDVASFVLTDTTLDRTGTGQLTLASIESATLTGGGSANSFTVSGWTGTGTLDGAGGTDTVVATNDVASFVLTDTTLDRTGTGQLTLASIESATLTGGGSANSFTVSGWTGTGTLDGAGGTDTVVATNDVASFVLTDTTLDRTGTGQLTLASIESATLTGGGSANSFTVSGWTGTGTLDGAGGTDTVVASQDAATFTLTDTTLDRTGTGQLTLTAIETATLTGGGSANTFNVSTWTGTANLDGAAGDDVFNVTTSASGTVNVTGGTHTTADTLNVTGSGAIGVSASAVTNGQTVNYATVEAVNVNGGGAADTFTLTGSAAGVTYALNGNGGTNTVVLSGDGDFTLTDTSLSTTAAGFNSAFGLTSITVANLTGGASANSFTVSGWTGTGTLDGAGGTDTVVATNDVASFVLTDTTLDRTGTGQLTLASIESATLTGGGSANSFTVSGWTGTGTLDGAGGTDTVVATNDVASFVLTDTTLDRTGTGQLTLASIESATLTGGGSANSFTVSGWTGTGTLDGAGGTDTVVASQDAATFTLTDTTLDRTGTGQLTLTAIETATLTGGGSANTFNVSTWTGTANLDGAAGDDVFNVTTSASGTVNVTGGTHTTADTLNVTGSGAIGVSASAVTNGQTVNYATVEAVNVNGGGAADTFTLTGSAAGVTYALNGNGGTNTVVLSGDGDFTLTDTSLSTTAAGFNSAFGLTSITVANLTGGASANSFTVSGWTGTGTLDGAGGTDTVVASQDAATFTLTDTTLDRTGTGQLTLTAIETATLTGGGSANTFNVSTWTGTANLDGAAGDDVFNVTTSASGTVNVTGGTHTTADTLNVTGSGAIGVSASAVTNGQTVNYATVEAVNVNGGGAADTFTLTGSAAGVTYALNGNGGTNTVVLSGDGDFTLTDTSLSTTAAGFNSAFGLTSITVANLTGGASANSFTVSGWTGTGTLDGAGGTDTVVASQDAATFTLTDTTLDRTGTGQLTLTAIETATLTGGGSANTFNVSTWTGTANLDGAAGDDVFNVTTSASGTVNVTGGTHTTADTLNVTGSGAIGVSASAVTNGQTVNYATVEAVNVNGGGAADTFTLTGSAAGVTYALNGNGGTNTVVLSGDGDFTLTDTSLSTTAAGFNSAFGLTSITVANLTGGASANSFTVSGWTGTGTLDGAGGTDTVVATNDVASFVLTDTTLDRTGTGQLTLASIESATLTGGGSANSFTLSGWTGSGSITGGGNTDTLIGPNTANTWNITGNGSGNINATVTFAGIANLTGGTANDSFVFSDTFGVAGTIDGGGGATNTLNYSAYTTNVTVNLATSSATGTGGFAGINTFVGGSATDTFVGANVANTWTINTPNAGNVNGTSTFSSFGNLTGGTNTDTFTLAGGSLSGALDGGGAAAGNTLAGSTTYVVSGANSGTATGVTGGFTNIGNLTGTGGADSFTFQAAGTLAGNVDGLGNTDTVDLSAKGGAVTIDLQAATFTGISGTFTSIESFVGNGAGSTIVGPNGGATFNVTGANSGTAAGTTFSQVGNLTGGTGNDTFSVSTGTLTGAVNGGTGADTLDLSGKAGVVAINLQTGAATGVTGGFASIESVAGNGNNTTLTGPAAGSTYSSSGSNSGSAGATSFSGIGNITTGGGNDTFASLNITGNLIDPGGTVAINGAVSTGGNQTYSGAVTIGAAITISAGGNISFGTNTVTDPGFDLVVTAGGNLTPGTMDVGAGRVQLFAAGLMVGGAGQSVTGTSTQQNVMSSGANVSALNVNFSNQILLLTGAAGQWDLTGPPVVGSGLAPVFQIGNGSITVTYNGTLVSGAAVAAIQQSNSVIGATLAEIARAALLEAQDTDSVQKQIAYGFAGDVGTTPPMDHRIDETGISVPICFNDSREGQTCR